VKAILVGTRRTDPHGEHLTHFDPTDSGWPAFVRIHPVIKVKLPPRILIGLVLTS
jgi:FAD synthetase